MSRCVACASRGSVVRATGGKPTFVSGVRAALGPGKPTDKPAAAKVSRPDSPHLSKACLGATRWQAEPVENTG